MAKDKTIKGKKEQQICAILPSDDQLTGRAGLSVFALYLRNIGLFPNYDRLFGKVRKNGKRLAVTEMFVQILSFFMDGTSRHLNWFDHLAADDAYAGLLGTGRLASSHAVKRFIGAISFCRIYLFRRLLQDVFLWRLKHTRPEVIMLGIDTTVLDNDDAEKRHGVQPTYKKVKGFQPLQMNWGRYVVDAVFRGGKKHSNHGNTVNEMLVHMVRKIRNAYREEVPIIVRMDAGFFDDEVFKTCEQLQIGYLCGGKQYSNVLDEVADAVDWQSFKKVETDSKSWMYTEFMSRQKKWKKERRTIFSTLWEEDGQYLLQGICRDSVIITNMGMGEKESMSNLPRSAARTCSTPESFLASTTKGEQDELTNRALKTFGHEQLPFKRFTANSAWYYLMVLGNNLFEAFKEDVTEAVIPVSAYADTFRRRFIDTAGKLVRHAGKLVMKVNKVDYVRLKFDQLYEKCRVGLPRLE
uniref:Transposase DDE domain-containing protein n=1 Tax=Chlorobium phaeobacteroides (strain BS1) TaxID=331678 RepID=B3EME0_CHLPB